MTNRAQQLRDRREEATRQLVEIFDASGANYTSAAAIHHVIRVNPGALMRDAVDAIHARKYR